MIIAPVQSRVAGPEGPALSATASDPGRWSDGKGAVDDGLRLGHDIGQVRRAAKALRVNLVHVLRSRRSCREPSAPRHDLETADRFIVRRRARQPRLDRLAGKAGRAHVLRRQLLEPRFLFGRRWSVDSRVVRSAEALFQFLVADAGIFAGARY